MRSIILVFLSFFLVSNTYAQKEVRSEIKEVSVFLSGAQISRTAKASIASGNSILKFTGITRNLDPNSIQLNATGKFTILSVKHQINYLEEKEESAESKKLREQLINLEAQLRKEQAMMQVYNEEESMILANKAIGGQESGVSVEELKATAAFYRTKLTEIKLEKLNINETITKLQEDIRKIKNQLNQSKQKRKGEPLSEILVAVNAKSAVQGTFNLSYMVHSAGWKPTYDLRVKDINKPIDLYYKASVFQSSGEDWDNVKLKLSTGNPQQSGTKPELFTWWLNQHNPYAYQRKEKKRNLAPMAKMEMAEDMAMDEEVAAAAPAVTQVENTTSIEFQIEEKYDIPSNGVGYLVQIEQYELPAQYEYYAAPKLDKDAFLTAQVSNWDQYNLLNGEALLFFEGTYLGKSYLDVQNVSDTLDISLGRDKSIVISRKKQKQYSEKQFIGNKKTETIAWEIEVRNKKKQNIKIVIEDQFPVSQTEEIEIKLKDTGKAKVNETTGKLRWEINLKAGSQEKIDFRYTVKSPKKWNVILE